jgi:hypothetical protein
MIAIDSARLLALLQPHLTSTMAVAVVRGLQGTHPSGLVKVRWADGCRCLVRSAGEVAAAAAAAAAATPGCAIHQRDAVHLA